MKIHYLQQGTFGLFEHLQTYCGALGDYYKDASITHYQTGAVYVYTNSLAKVTCKTCNLQLAREAERNRAKEQEDLKNRLISGISEMFDYPQSQTAVESEIERIIRVCMQWEAMSAGSDQHALGPRGRFAVAAHARVAIQRVLTGDTSEKWMPEFDVKLSEGN